ncbi:MAG: hypothetical protein ACTJHC_07105 [Vagococcus sp.]
MNTFEIIIIVGIAITILLFILTLVSIIKLFVVKRSIKTLENNRPRDKRKKRRWKKTLALEKKNKTKWVKTSLFSLIGTVLIGAGAGYAKFYQATNISEQDTDNIVYGYYLLDQMEEQLKDIEKKNDNKSASNIHKIAVSLSSFASKKGSDRSVEEA